MKELTRKDYIKTEDEMKNLLLPILLLAAIYLATRVVFPYNWHITPYHNRTISRVEQADRNRVFKLLYDGEGAWEAGRFKEAEDKFNACLNDKANFDNKADYDRKARADLAKLHEQMGRHRQAPLHYIPIDYLRNDDGAGESLRTMKAPQ